MDLFKVATEFRFDIGHAVLSSELLQSKVQGISDAADQALINFQSLGAGVVATMGLGGGGMLGALLKAIQVSDKFNSSALSFSNIISANMNVLTGDIHTFNQRLDTSKNILMDISKVANQFSLDESSLLNMTKLLAPVLVPHGLAGANFSNAIDLGRNVLKASPSLGLQPGEIEGQLIRAITGQASMQDTLFRRLVSDTSAFSGLNGPTRGGGHGGQNSGAGMFNAMSFEKRFEMLHKGLNQFASDVDVINGNAGTLTGHMTRMKNLFGGINSVLKPLGDAILPPLLRVFHEFNKILDSKVRESLVQIGKMLKGLLDDPRALLVNLMQFRELGKDMKRGSWIFGMATLIGFIKHIFGMMGINLVPIFRIFAQLVGRTALEIGGLLFSFRSLGLILRVLGFIAGSVFWPIALLIGVLQTISRARAIAKVEDAKNIISLAPAYLVLFARLKQAFSNIIYPITSLIDTVAEFIAPIFEMTMWMQYALPVFSFFVTLFEELGKAVIGAMGILEGFLWMIFRFGENLASGKFTSLFSGMGDAFKDGLDDFLRRNAARLNDPNGAVVNQVTNIGKVEQRFEFKEQQEPDRIAFTVKEQLLKAARNPRQGRGTGLQNAFSR